MTWLDKLLVKVDGLPGPPADGAPETPDVAKNRDAAEKRLADEIARHLDLVREAKSLLSRPNKNDAKGTELYTAYEKYLVGLLNPENGFSLRDRKIQLDDLRKQITEIAGSLQ